MNLEEEKLSGNNNGDKDYERQLLKIRDYSEEQYDKLIIYLSSGALVLTVGFVDKLINFDNRISHLGFLFFSWAAFVVSLVVILLSHKTSCASMDHYMNDKKEKSDFCDKWTKGLNWAGFAFFVVGVVSFFIFMGVSISKKGGDSWPKKEVQAKNSLEKQSPQLLEGKQNLQK